MKRTIAIIIAALLITDLIAQVKMTADPEKTALYWLGERPVMQETGTISLKEGWLNWGDNKILSGEFTIDMSTIKVTGDKEKLVGHLKADDFFSVDKFPTSTLVITGSDPFIKNAAIVRGSLTIKGITHPIEFKALMQKKDEGTWFYTNMSIDRAKYDVRYGSGTFFDNLGDRTIYDDFKLKINLFVR